VALVMALGGCPQDGGEGGGNEDAPPVSDGATPDGSQAGAGTPEDAETYCLFKVDGDAFSGDDVALRFEGKRMDDAYWLYNSKGGFTRVGFTGLWKTWKVGLSFKVPVSAAGTVEIQPEDHGFNTGCELTFYAEDVPSEERPRYYVTQGTVTLEAVEGDYLRGTISCDLVSIRQGMGGLINTPREQWVTAKLTEGRFRAKFDERMEGERWPGGQ
jgi:hypothetical protein